MMKSMPLPDSPRLMMALFGPLVGIVSGVVIGLFAVIAGKFLKSARVAATP
jgi:cobalamin synthase